MPNSEGITVGLGALKQVRETILSAAYVLEAEFMRGIYPAVESGIHCHSGAGLISKG